MTITLSAAGGESGVEGSGVAEGWDPEEHQTNFNDTDPGGQFVRQEAGSEPDQGYACVVLDRSDTTGCTAAVACVQWGGNSGTNVAPYMYDVDEYRWIGTEGDASTFTQEAVVSGSLTMDRVEWDGRPECGASALALSWAFDETDPHEAMGSNECL